MWAMDEEVFHGLLATAGAARGRRQVAAVKVCVKVAVADPHPDDRGQEMAADSAEFLALLERYHRLNGIESSSTAVLVPMALPFGQVSLFEVGAPESVVAEPVPAKEEALVCRAEQYRGGAIAVGANHLVDHVPRCGVALEGAGRKISPPQGQGSDVSFDL